MLHTNPCNKTILFDFDGTLANTLKTVVEIYNKVAPEYNCKTVELEDVSRLQAMTISHLMKEQGISHITLAILLVRVRKELHINIDHVKPFFGIEEQLQTLKKMGYQLGIMSSNSQKNVHTFLESNNMKHLFDFVHTSKNIFGKHTAIKRIISNLSLQTNDVVYVGDETRDIEACKKIGVKIAAVSWGYNLPEVLQAMQPDVLIDEPHSLANCISKLAM
ncbi:MAG: HAD-IA family hydrolase [Paludibacteraceae bacterium]|jgi:phosphoglycolate phosphatase|nr:HAD-IA family hydrolase [Paludibacteraceae bacterium]NLK93240.1 HAD-IA family hydrolase [Bacteroidales bacterium]MBP6435831.1 HAD-IA family hydrolase [Paludibacteraceae bacterium]HNZ85548.1 HAD-IA family hydrolase [Paludibacteraceae bacterium]HOR40814.1 HAD-IA family hydrolase [Paludibacteraceae bacterium]